jgi:hypothetical protein
MKSKILAFAAILVFGTGVGFFVYGVVFVDSHHLGKPLQGKDVKVKLEKRRHHHKSGIVELLQTEEWTQKSDGSYRLIKTLWQRNGEIAKMVELASENGKGFFKIDRENQKLIWLADRAPFTPEFQSDVARKAEHYVGDGQILGHHVIIQKFSNEPEYGEVHLSTEYNDLVLKMIERFDDATIITEAVEITELKSGALEFEPLPEWEVDYSKMKTDQEKEKQRREEKKE